jgi:hypothetical protein
VDAERGEVLASGMHGEGVEVFAHVGYLFD